MTDPRLLVRLDALLGLAALALVVACFALMTVDLAIGALALGVVVLVGAVGIRSYVRAGRRAAERSG